MGVNWPANEALPPEPPLRHRQVIVLFLPKRRWPVRQRRRLRVRARPQWDIRPPLASAGARVQYSAQLRGCGTSDQVRYERPRRSRANSAPARLGLRPISPADPPIALPIARGGRCRAAVCEPIATSRRSVPAPGTDQLRFRCWRLGCHGWRLRPVATRGYGGGVLRFEGRPGRLVARFRIE